jgi:hypothetical protein
LSICFLSGPKHCCVYEFFVNSLGYFYGPGV